ncbi:MAG: MBL fold metallo-hydrolase [Alphaproteobacteria bacterium]|nr:MAG: MBL fold metallo-hydrolase [Alphaproteobacteria bacterium]
MSRHRHRSTAIRFLGAAATVTGSKFLLETAGGRLLVDCGLFQGYKYLRRLNWRRPPFDPTRLDAVLVSHAHLDHSGYLPRLRLDGYRGPIHATRATVALAGILLPDSGHLQEHDAELANRMGFSKHRPARPLYTAEDARAVLPQFVAHDFGCPFSPARGVQARFHHAGHILGAAIIEIETAGRRLVFTGDLGRLHSPMMMAPARIEEADVLVIESTYGNRRHDRTDPQKRLEKLIHRTIQRGGTIVIPAFAVGRAQLLLYHLHRLRKDGRIPRTLPIYLDSPMAIHVSDLTCAFQDELRLAPDDCRAVCATAHYVRDWEASAALDRDRRPKIIISAAGMATGGRVLHHLAAYLPDHRNLILFTGFQAGGTRGRKLLDGAREVKIHGRMVPVRAEVKSLDMLSAHADRDELLAWARGFRRPPRQCFVVHGEPAAADALRHALEHRLGWPDVRVPILGERIRIR